MRKGTSTATIYIKLYKQADKWAAIPSLKGCFDCGLNQEMLGAVSFCLCTPKTIHAEFMLERASIKQKRAGQRRAQ